MITFDPAKDVIIRHKHEISLARAEDFDAAWITPDTRKDYGEHRYRAVSFLMGDSTPWFSLTVRNKQ